MATQPSSDQDGPGGVQAVQLVLDVLEHLAKQEVAGVTEIAKALDTTKARVHRHLRTLVNKGYVVQEPGGERYCAGPRLMVLARMLASENSLITVARPVMLRLRDEVGHSITIARINGHSVSMVDCLQGNGFININVRIGYELPLHANAAGKLLYAFDERLRASIGSHPLERYTEHTITDPQRLLQEVERVRRQGWANSPEEFVVGISSLGAPIFDRDNRLIATIGLVDSIQFLRKEPPLEEVSAVTAAAAEITRHLALQR